MRLFAHLAAASVVVAAGLEAQTPPALMLRDPSLSATEICFEYGDDIWLVPRAGGTARRLTSSGAASGCRFSPDGKWVAYTGHGSGNADAYVIAAEGGIPKRLTWHPADDVVRGWTPDGKVLFMSTRDAVALTQAYGAPRLFVQAIDAVAPTAIDLPSAWSGALSSDGKRLAYLPYPPANDIWKRYRGGRATPIWIATLSNAAVEKVPRTNSNDRSPMWVGDTVYFISDRDGPATLYAYDARAKRVMQRVENRGLDLKSASAGPG